MYDALAYILLKGNYLPRIFQIQADPPVPRFHNFATFLANYLRFAFQNGFRVSFFF